MVGFLCRKKALSNLEWLRKACLQNWFLAISSELRSESLDYSADEGMCPPKVLDSYSTRVTRQKMRQCNLWGALIFALVVWDLKIWGQPSGHCMSTSLNPNKVGITPWLGWASLVGNTLQTLASILAGRIKHAGTTQSLYLVPPQLHPPVSSFHWFESMFLYCSKYNLE